MQLTNGITKTDDWEQRANKVLSHFNYQSPDEIDIYDICWRHGVSVKPLSSEFLEPQIDFDAIKHLRAFSIPKPKARRGIIYISSELDAVEKKILLAEEFCHCYSHYASQLNLDKHSISKMENQAKRMAAYLLMPAIFLKQVYAAAVSEPVLISDIADHFVVTEEFASYRLELTHKHKVDGFALLKERLGSIEWFL
ncbi:ImmA/IrrE family metallo-endopeptidase [Robertmurraya sp. FSL W8-0741]|uniref:ImmA/IrrE family metallo-endopeptidase n=1 Tax=Robertmurraya sp. FSL W8-0741 TaxID=2954629 RepID=UPI0030FC8957